MPTLEANGQQYAAEITALSETTARYSITIASLQTKAEQLELASHYQHSIKLAALQDNLDALRQELHLHRSGPPWAPSKEPSHLKHSDSFINVVSDPTNTGKAGSFKPLFKEKYNLIKVASRHFSVCIRVP